MPFEITRLSIALRARDRFVSESLPGVTLRGAFGYALRRVACVERRSECAGCARVGSCEYAKIFETPGGGGGGDRVPHPFILEPPDLRGRAAEPGETIPLGLVLVGAGIDMLPTILRGVREMCTAGLGRDRARFALERVVDVGGADAWSWNDGDAPPRPATVPRATLDFSERGSARACALEFVTPVRLKTKGQVVRGAPDFGALARALARRIADLGNAFCGGEPPLDYRKLARSANGITIASSEMRWVAEERRSTRHDKPMSVGGVVGRVEYAGELGPFLPLLAAGEMLHVGKLTAFGHGRYRLEV